jgi:hypothetical protein
MDSLHPPRILPDDHEEEWMMGPSAHHGDIGEKGRLQRGRALSASWRWHSTVAALVSCSVLAAPAVAQGTVADGPESGFDGTAYETHFDLPHEVIDTAFGCEWEMKADDLPLPATVRLGPGLNAAPPPGSWTPFSSFDLRTGHETRHTLAFAQIQAGVRAQDNEGPWPAFLDSWESEGSYSKSVEHKVEFRRIDETSCISNIEIESRPQTNVFLRIVSPALGRKQRIRIGAEVGVSCPELDGFKTGFGQYANLSDEGATEGSMQFGLDMTGPKFSLPLSGPTASGDTLARTWGAITTEEAAKNDIRAVTVRFGANVDFNYQADGWWYGVPIGSPLNYGDDLAQVEGFLHQSLTQTWVLGECVPGPGMSEESCGGLYIWEAGKGQ